MGNASSFQVNYENRNSTAIAIVQFSELTFDRLVVLTVGTATSVIRDLITGMSLTVDHSKHLPAAIESKITGQLNAVPYCAHNHTGWRDYLYFRSLEFSRKRSISIAPPRNAFGAKWKKII